MTDYGKAQRDRLSYIDLRLRFLGEIRRADLMSRFGIESAAATRDLSIYRDLVPSNLIYDRQAKIYRAGKWFNPLLNFTAERVLSWLSKGYGDSYPEKFQPIITTYTSGPVHTIDLNILAVITQSIHLHRAVEISYRSLTSGLTTRSFVPFALADNGFRWHVRGFDRRRQDFLDLVLTRVADAHIIEGDISEQEGPDRDIQWNRIVELELVPHPANVQHPDTVEADYGMTDGVLKMQARAALVGYLLRRWNVDCSPDHRLRGPEFHLWLRNREALYGVANTNLAPGYSQ